jgi:hypothetical protein
MSHVQSQWLDDIYSGRGDAEYSLEIIIQWRIRMAYVHADKENPM